MCPCSNDTIHTPPVKCTKPPQPPLSQSSFTHQDAYSRFDRLLKTIHLSPDASRTQINMPAVKTSKPHLNTSPKGDEDLPDLFNQMQMSQNEPRSLDLDAAVAGTSKGRPSRSQTKASQKVGNQKFEWTDLFPSGDLYPLVTPVKRVQRVKSGESPRDYSPVSSPRWPKSSLSVRLPPSVPKNLRTSTTHKVPSTTTPQTDDWSKAVNIWTDSFINTLPTYEPQASSSTFEVRNGSACSPSSHASSRVSSAQAKSFLYPVSPLYQSLNCHRNSPSSPSAGSSYQAPTNLSSRGLPRSSKLLLDKKQKGNTGRQGSGRGDKCDLEVAIGDEDILDRYFRQARAPPMLYNEVPQTNASEEDDAADDERLISITDLVSSPPITLKSTLASATEPTNAPIGVGTNTNTIARNDNNGIVSRSVTASKRKERIAERPNSS